MPDQPAEPVRSLDYTGPVHLRSESNSDQEDDARPDMPPQPTEASTPSIGGESLPATPGTPPGTPPGSGPTPAPPPSSEPPLAPAPAPAPGPEATTEPEPGGPPPPPPPSPPPLVDPPALPADRDDRESVSSSAVEPAPPPREPPSPAREVVAKLELPSDAESLADIVRRCRESLNAIDGGYTAVLTISVRTADGNWAQESIRIEAHLDSGRVFMEWLDSARAGRRLTFVQFAPLEPVRIHLGPKEPRTLGERITVNRDHALFRGPGQLSIEEYTVEAWIGSLERGLASTERAADKAGMLSFEGTEIPRLPFVDRGPTGAEVAKPHYRLTLTHSDGPEALRRDWYIDTELMIPAWLVLSNAEGKPVETYHFSHIKLDRVPAADALRVD